MKKQKNTKQVELEEGQLWQHKELKLNYSIAVLDSEYALLVPAHEGAELNITISDLHSQFKPIHEKKTK